MKTMYSSPSQTNSIYDKYYFTDLYRTHLFAKIHHLYYNHFMLISDCIFILISKYIVDRYSLLCFCLNLISYQLTENYDFLILIQKQ